MEHSENTQILLALICEAFKDVYLEDGVSLHQTIVIDNYGSNAEMVEARLKDEKKDWQKLISKPELLNIHGIGGLSFFDAKGLRFHLPAYLSSVVINPDLEISDSLIFTLTHKSEYNDNRLSLLNPQMKHCIGVILSYFRTLPNFEYCQTSIEEVLPFYMS